LCFLASGGKAGKASSVENGSRVDSVDSTEMSPKAKPFSIRWPFEKLGKLLGGDWNHGIFLVNLWLIYG
jgi:hypothetical protein